MRDADGLQPLRPVGGSQCRRPASLRLCAAAAAGRGQGPLCRRAGRADRRRDPRQALDAAERVAVDYEPLPAVTTAAAARRAGRAGDLRRGAGQRLHRLAHRRRRSRRCGVRRSGACRRRCTSTITASSPTRWSRAASSALYDAATGRYTLHVSSQNIHAQPRPHRPRAGRRRRRRCASSRPMSAAASAPRTSSMPSTC